MTAESSGARHIRGAHAVQRTTLYGPSPRSSGRADRPVRVAADERDRVGYKASAEQFGPRELVELAVRAEEVGLDSVVSDHFQPWRHVVATRRTALSWLAAVGERTRGSCSAPAC